FARFVLDDMRALQQTADSATLTVDCPAFMATYDGLDRHLARGAEASAWAQQVIDASSLIYARCQNSLTPHVGFEDALSDFLDWENTLRQLASDLESQLQ
ncbi:MAG: hypothetical protein JXA10_17165, partial [Anaerolineae bacterium]|nr:hypothetical protein [Anaerolineae bacterium]